MKFKKNKLIPMFASIVHSDWDMATTFEYLDQDSFRKLYCTDQEPPRMKFYISGIKCSKCIAKIENIKGQDPEVRSLEVDLSQQTALIELQSLKGSFAKVVEKLASLGFQAIPLKPQEDSSLQWVAESRNDLIRIAVAGFCAGNIMMLAFAIYFGLEGELRKIFEFAQFFLYLPVVIYVAKPFYKGLAEGIQNRSFSIDGPMAVASFLGFAVSTWNLFRGHGSIYFDSTSGFLFLILTTRFFQKKTRAEFFKFLRPQSFSETFKAQVKVGSDWQWVPSQLLQKGQTLRVQKGEFVPADGFLLQSSALLELSVLDGESRPRFVQKGFPVKAGSRLLSDSLQLEVEKTGSQTMLGQILASLKTASIEDTDSSKISNRASQWLLLIVLSFGAGLFVYGLFGQFEIYFERAFALIVLACPCAMAFGTPLAFAFTMRKAQEQGIIIKSAKVFESLPKVKNIFFDKTGTLTDRSWKITRSSLPELPTKYQKIILALESESQHPVAFALRELWQDISVDTEIEEKSLRTLKNGVEARINAKNYRFTSFVEDGTKWYGLFIDEENVWKFQLSAELRSGVREAILKLLEHGYQILLLSGDSHDETLRTARELGLPQSAALSGLTPQQKAEIVSNTPFSMMIGDGVNDTLALQKAEVGIAVQGGVDLALRSADILFLNDNLISVLDLIELSKTAGRQIRRNLLMALVYNGLGGVAAVLGFINPFVAALLMPISSLCILAATWWGTRK